MSRPPATPRARLLEAARELNAGRYFEAHEALEEGLEEVPDDVWELFVGLIQVAVGYHKLASGHPGPKRMLRLGLGKIASLPPDAAGIDLEGLRERIRNDLAALEAGSFDESSFRRHPPRLVPLTGRARGARASRAPRSERSGR